MGHLSKSKKLIRAACASVGRIVWLDIAMPEEEFDGSFTHTGACFVLFDQCWLPRAPGEELSPFNSTGFEFLLKPNPKATDWCIYPKRGMVKIKGYFAILGIEGPHQGIMSIAMKPLNIEDVRLL